MRRTLLALLLALAACGGDGAAPATTSPATTTAPATTTTPAESRCRLLPAPVAVGTVVPPELDEISGIAVSRAHPGVLWAHEDSGSGPVLWALSRDGELLARVEIAGATAVDWEDLALGPGPGGDHLYLADTGDNAGRRESVTLYRLPEPGLDTASAGSEALVITYPDGAHDVEALLVDPGDGAVYLITKGLGTEASLYRVPAAAWDKEAAVAEMAGTVPVGPLAPVTAADIASDGSVLVVRTYRSVLLFERSPGSPLPDALAGPGCAGPVPPELQGEAVAWTGDGYLTVAEGAAARIYLIAG